MPVEFLTSIHRSYLSLNNIKPRRILVIATLAAGFVVGILLIARPIVTNSLILHGEARFNAYDYDEAVSYFQKAALIAPTRRQAEAHSKLGFAYGFMGQYELALQSVNRALEIDPQYAPAYENRGSINLYLGDYQKAIDDFSIAIHMTPDVAILYYERAMAYEKVGDKQSAIEDYVTYLDLDTTGDEYITTRVNEKIIELRNTQ